MRGLAIGVLVVAVPDQDHGFNRHVRVGLIERCDNPFGHTRTECIDRWVVDDDDADFTVFLKPDNGGF